LTHPISGGNRVLSRLPFPALFIFEGILAQSLVHRKHLFQISSRPQGEKVKQV
jgi:hypothetical protein